jgi:acetolactate synthase-1/2/3 large subunit
LQGFDPAVEVTANAEQQTLVPRVREVIEAFNRAERPLLFAGNGIRLARAESEFAELKRLL